MKFLLTGKHFPVSPNPITLQPITKNNFLSLIQAIAMTWIPNKKVVFRSWLEYLTVMNVRHRGTFDLKVVQVVNLQHLQCRHPPNPLSCMLIFITIAILLNRNHSQTSSHSIFDPYSKTVWPKPALMSSYRQISIIFWILIAGRVIPPSLLETKDTRPYG